MGNAIFFEWEPGLMEWLQSHIGSFGTSLMSFFSAFGEETILIAFMCILYFIIDKEAAKFTARRFMIAGCFYAGIKNIVCRLRPYMVHDNVKCLKPVDKNADIMDVVAQGYSFPSGHSSGSSSIFIGSAVYLKNRIFSIISVIIVLLVGISRFCLGVHYPTDVLVGWGIGIASIFLFSLLEKLIKKRWIIYLIFTVLFIPGFFFCTTNDFYTNYGLMTGMFAADLFEERFAKFGRPANLLIGVLRIAGAIALYFGVNALLKLPFDADFLASGTTAAHIARSCRYFLVILISLGIYPACFKLFRKKEKQA
ncbi:MAG: phosphatase PAP2 family protein [Lachnospiraceae bacterium]|nr:phosphatase PAP2 family protein [Lachnospiraceae bacterium]